MGEDQATTSKSRCPPVKFPREADALADVVANHVVKLLCDARRATLDAYLRIGDEVHRLRVVDACGSPLVRRLGERVGMDESGLQRLGRMAEAIHGDERESICRLIGGRGLPLTASMVAELARLRHAGDRLELAQEAVECNLTVGQMRVRIAQLRKTATLRASPVVSSPARPRGRQT